VVWLLGTKAQIDDADVAVGRRMLVLEGALSQSMLVLTTGAFLIAFAIELGASNVVIGLLAAVGPLAQAAQIPAVLLVERLRRRRAIAVLAGGISRVMWFVMAAIPFVLPAAWAVPVLLICLAVHFGVGAVSGCAFNSWVRDLIPTATVSRFFARRLAIATALGAALSLCGGVAIDFWKARDGEPLMAYAALFIVGGACGIVGLLFLARAPEPTMPPAAKGGILRTFIEPLSHSNFRQLVIFLGWWSFAVNLAAPFFAVYMLQRLGLSMTWVLGLSVASQLLNVLFFPVWGAIAERLSNKSVLLFCGALFIFSFLLWPLSTLPERYVLTIPILLAFHILAGVSTAGVNLCAGNLVLKIAPYGKAGTFLAVNGLVCGLAATVAPIMAGLMADLFAEEELMLTLALHSGEGLHNPIDVPTLSISGLDFLFIIAFVLGTYAMHRLLSVKEQGEVESQAVRDALFGEMRRVARQVSTVAGVRQVLMFPAALLARGRRTEEDGEQAETD